MTASRNWVPGAKEIVFQLRTAGTRLGIISNTGTLSRTELAAQLPVDFDLAAFEAGLILLSSEVLVEKPDLALFQLAVTRAAVPGSRCLFCTENLLHTLAAQQVGMHVARIAGPPESDIYLLKQKLEDLGRLLPDPSSPSP